MKNFSRGGASRALGLIARRRADRRWALACALVGLGLVAVPAWSSVLGILEQLPGTAGCVSDGGSSGNCVDGTALDGASALAVTSNGLSVYAASATSNGVASFLRHPEGQLLQLSGQAGCVTQTGSSGACTVGRALQGARDVALTSKGDTLYVSAPGSNAVAVFAREKFGGITQLPGTAGCVSSDGTGGQCALATAMDGARAAVVSPDRKNVYVVARDADAVVNFSRDKNTGALTQLPGTSGCISRSTTNGLCAKGNGLDFPTAIAVTAKGENLYVAASGSSSIAVFDRDKTGLVSQLPGTAGCVSQDGTGGQCTVGRGLLGAFSVAVTKDGKFVYTAARDGNAIAVFARDKETGALTQLAGTAGCVSSDGSSGQCAVGRALNGPVSVTVSRDGGSLYVASSLSNAVAVFARDKKTGTLTQLPGTDGCVSNGGAGGCASAIALVEPSAVLVTRNGRNAYVATTTSDAVAAFARQ